MRLTLHADGVRAQPPPKKKEKKKRNTRLETREGRGGFLGSRGWRVCVMSAYLSLSPLLHFVLKFSIQKIKGGERRVSEQGEDETRGKKCHHGFHLESSANLSKATAAPRKATSCPKTHVL